MMMTTEATDVRGQFVGVMLLMILLVYAPNGLAEPINPLKNPTICGRPNCPTANLKFRYNNTVQYTYKYSTHVRTEFLGSGQDQSDVNVQATALLQFTKPCEGVLRLQDVRLHDESGASDYNDLHDEATLHPRTDSFAADLTAYELRFAYHDGIIEEVCPHNAEAIWTLNFKKGLLSMLQNSMRRFDVDYAGTETDVTGTCDVDYTLIGAVGTNLVLRKDKNLKTCTNRYKTNSVLQTVPYQFRQNIAVWPILKSTHSCNISVDHNIYQSVECYERHQLEPFSNRESGAVTHSRAHLELQNERVMFAARPASGDFYGHANEEEAAIKLRSTLLFDHQPTPRTTHTEIRASRDLLIRMCAVGYPNIQREFVEVFTQFLHTARHLSYKTLFHMLSRADSICGAQRNGRYHVVEALPQIGSSAAVRIMCEEIQKRTLPVNKVHNWLAAIGLLNRPDEEMLVALRQLMGFAHQHQDNKYILVATAVAHTFCRNQRHSCGDSPAIRSIVKFLAHDLSEALAGDVSDRATRERVVVDLKGIGNVGVVTPLLEQLLRELAQAQAIPVEYRLHAIYAHIRLDCRNSRNVFLDLYEDPNENAEVRIASYQQAMRCPSKSSVKRIKSVLLSEPVNQVGSYVWSSLNNLAKSSSPLNVEVQSLLVDEELSSRFKLDVRKFSRNYEQTLFFDEYNVGTRFDGNLIFGTESFLPRTVGFNISADLFGESVNLFEVNARMEGLESLAERTFGPNGALNAKYFGGKLNYLSKLWTDRFGDETKLLDKMNMRFRRNAAHDRLHPTDHRFANATLLADLYDAIHRTGYTLNYTFNQPHVAVATRMFGNDISYHTVAGEAELRSKLQAFSPSQQMAALFSGRQINYTKSGVQLDISYEVPLAVGLPLVIHAFGATSVDLRVSGDLKAADWQRARLDVVGRIKASAALEITASMRTEYAVGAAGIRVKANMFTSSAVDAALTVAGSSAVRLQFSLPQERNDIFSATSELLVIKRGEDVPQAGIEPRYANASCTWWILESAVGLKVCSEYSVPDVNDVGVGSTSLALPSGVVYPSLLLSGPVSLNIHLKKSDVTAKTFVFEYNWRNDDSVGGQRGSLLFHTPGSSILRQFSANLTRDAHNYNLTMSFQNGRLKHEASGRFRISENDKRINVSLVLDGKKNFALEMSLKRVEIRNGWKYFPLLVISINDEHIAGLTGSVRDTNKKGVEQFDLDLIFETRNSEAKLYGYITKTELTTTPKLTLAYQFSKTRQEFVELSGELSSRGQKSRTDYSGFVRLNSTAYPHFNFASKMKFISVLGHVEATVDFNNAVDLVDPDYLLTLRFEFAHSVQMPGAQMRTAVTLSATRPRSHVDLSLQLKLEENHKRGVEHHAFALVRVAPRKEGTVTVSVLFPRGPFFALDAALNITVPSFEPCTVALRWTGTRVNEYTVDFRGAWFTNHSIAATGLYQDISTQVKVHKHLKLLVTSPHFNETNVDVRFWRDEEETAIGVQVEHGAHPYAVQLKHSQRSAQPQTSYMGVTIIDKVYSVQAQLVKTERQQLMVEIHLDNVRDIHIALRGHSTVVAKEFGIDFQWDANRDPTQKIAISADLNTPHPQHMDGGFVVAYPDRSFSGTFDLDTSTVEWAANARVGWSATEAIAVQVRLGSILQQPAKQAWLQLHLTTPFADWQSNRLRTDLYLRDTLLRTNGSLSWGVDQRLAVALGMNYVHTEAELLGEVRAELNSTVLEVPNVLGSFKHHHRGVAPPSDPIAANAAAPHHIITDVHIRHGRIGEPLNVLAAMSKWTLALGRLRQNRSVKGSIEFRTPMAGYRRGGLYAKLAHGGHDQRLNGVVALDLESNRYRAYLDGHARRITDNMFSLNVTTPLEKFGLIVCRLGLSDRDRHAVAEVRLPASALGVELLWAVDALHSFDVLVSVETPLEAFQRVMLVAKMQPHTVDLRAAWNRVVLGYVGVWRMAGYQDVEYSYRVFTPLPNFAENGVVVRVVLLDGVDVEVTGRVSTYKIGVLVNGKRKPALQTLVGTQPQRSVFFSAETGAASDELADVTNFSGTKIAIGGSGGENSSSGDSSNDEDAEADEEFDDYVPLSYLAKLEVDTIVWPTVVGKVEIDEVVIDDFVVVGSLKLPQGTVLIKDRFLYPDYFNINNTLKLNTPFASFSEIHLKYTHAIDIGLSYTGSIDLAFGAPLQLVQLGLGANYLNLTEPGTNRQHLQLQLRTPIPSLERCNFSGLIALEHSVYRGNVTASTPDTRVSVAGHLESETQHLDTGLQLQLSAPLVPQLAGNVHLKYTHFDDADSHLESGFAFGENHTEPTRLAVRAQWSAANQQPIRAMAQLQSNLLPVLQSLNATVLIDGSDATVPSAEAALSFGTVNGQVLGAYEASAARNHDLVTVALRTPPHHFGNFTLHGVLTPDATEADLFRVQGTCAHNAETVSPLSGTVRLTRNVPVEVQLHIQPAGAGRPQTADLSYALTDTSLGKRLALRLDAGVDQRQSLIGVDGELTMYSKYNWQVTGAVRTAPGLLGPIVSTSAGQQQQAIDLDVAVRPLADAQFGGLFSLTTPWQELGLDRLRAAANLTLNDDGGRLRQDVLLNDVHTRSDLTWMWEVQRNMQASVRTVVESLRSGASRSYEMGAKYVNHPTSDVAKRVRIDVTVGLNVDDRWQVQSNATWRELTGERGGTLSVRLPDGSADVHKMSGQCRSNLDPMAIDLSRADVSYDVRYETTATRRLFASRGQYRNVTDLQGFGVVEWGNGGRVEAAEANVQMLRKEQRREFSARVATPWNAGEDTMRASGFYDVLGREQQLKCTLNYPASRQIANTDIAYTSFENMKGSANCTTPFANLTWLHGEFDFVTTGSQSNRFLKAIWPADNAFFDLRNTYTSEQLDRDLHGVIKMSVPLTSRHTTDIVYGLKNRPQLATGNCVVHYNGDQVLDGQYTSKSESRAGFERELVDITLENPRNPLGIAFVHTRNNEDEEAGTYDMKRAEVFDLKDRQGFNITGELHVRTTDTGQDFKVVAVHPNRTPVVLTTMYDLQERVTRTHSKVLLSEDVWLAYTVVLHNETNDDLESRSIDLELSYPKRNLSTSGRYAQTEHTFDSDVTFQWTDPQTLSSSNGQSNPYDYPDYGYSDPTDEEPAESAPKRVQAALQWRRYPIEGAAHLDERNHTVRLSVYHPSFEHNVTLDAAYHRNAVDLFAAAVSAEYCNLPDHRLDASAVVKDVSAAVGYRNYTFNIAATHVESGLHLLANGSMAARPGLYETSSVASYRQSYVPVREGRLVGKLDVVGKEIHYWKSSPQKTVRLWAISDGQYPVYHLNGSLQNGEEVNSTGSLYANIDDKYIQLHVNMTPDAAQNLRMVGTIPDARSASFDLWRDYDEFRIVDVAYYLRMNHSRLVTSRLVWRPTIKAEVKAVLKKTAIEMYDEVSHSAENWIKTLYAESKTALKDIWNLANPYIETFLEDVSGLHVLENDLDEFRLFVNQSYESNDFYVKSMVNVTRTVLDELSLRNHIDSLPQILSEIWQLLGNTGKALQESIVWVMESLKTSYSKALEMIGRLFKGDVMEQLSNFMEMGIAKYDKIVKDLHVSFIRYVERTWGRITNAVSAFWQASMRRIEPTLMQFLHYMESMVWNVSREIFDFLYKRTNEIVDSPYFAKVSNFTQDLDTLYRDIVSHDVITNVRKYGALTIAFLRAKYFALVPFGHELSQICEELMGELRKLHTLEPVQFVGARIAELQAQLTWFANELQLEKRALQLWTVVRQKITTLGQTALQTDDKYREAKTQFVFDPDVGVMELQQKLPMAWHAFNETPVVEEIAEYKALQRFTGWFQSSSNISVASLMNDYRRYTDVDMWLPPFRAHAMMIGHRHYVTFDGRFVAVDTTDQCEVLLAHDFLAANFTLSLQPVENNVFGKRITLVSEGHILDMVIDGTNVHIAHNQPATLPLAIGSLIIDRDLDILHVTSAHGFSLTCNLRFGICSLELDGWYFGRTAGILGNMNNELHDDYRGPRGQSLLSDRDFARSWSLNTTRNADSSSCEAPAASVDRASSVEPEFDDDVRKLCDTYFHSKLSPFAGCFGLVDSRPYLRMCLDLAAQTKQQETAGADPTPVGMCAVALAYMESCERIPLPLRVPDVCINCQLADGSFVPEGTFVNATQGAAPNASDVVFIVEAKECNRDVFTAKNLGTLIGSLQRELVTANVTNNRFAVLAYGAAAPPFNTPRTVVHNNLIFAESRHLKYHFEPIRPTHTNGTTAGFSRTDTFAAISAATKLSYRPGAAKAFVLLPCSAAKAGHQQLDYSSVLQQLLEDGIQLHVLMNGEFGRGKSSVFGIDRGAVYTNKDPTADNVDDRSMAALRKQIVLPKAELGLSAALAMETSGSIFTGSKLRPNDYGRVTAKNFAGVFGRRVAKTASALRAQRCECSGHDTGVPFMMCTEAVDYGSEDDASYYEEADDEEVEVDEEEVDE